MGVTGAVPDVEGDFFQLVTLNNSANKIDWWQRRAVTYDVRHDPTTGVVDATATIAITNGAPGQGQSELLIGGLAAEPGPPGRSRLTIDVYSALDLQGATVDGRPVRMSRTDAYDRNLYWTVQMLQPGQRLVLELHLRGVFEPGEPYVLDLGNQSVIRPDVVDVLVTPAEGAEVVAAEGLAASDDRASARFELVEPRRFRVLSEP
jgi:hypothetical protein